MHCVVSATYCWLLHKQPSSTALQPYVFLGFTTQEFAQSGKDCRAWSVTALADKAPAKRTVASVKRIVVIDTGVKTERLGAAGRSKGSSK